MEISLDLFKIRNSAAVGQVVNMSASRRWEERVGGWGGCVGMCGESIWECICII